MAPIIQSKTCSKCNVEKMLTDFNGKSRNSDGRRADCRECQNALGRQYAMANAHRLVEKNRRYRSDNPEKARAWSIRNAKKRRSEGKVYPPEKAAAMVKQWWKNNPLKRKEYNDRYYGSPKGKLSASIRAAIRSEIHRGSKGGRRTFDLLGYGPAELMSHLEKQFLPGMSWANYGRGGWHVDHIIPLSAFNYETPDHADFRRAWSLKNLQPLWEVANLSKGARLTFPFQPSLAL